MLNNQSSLQVKKILICIVCQFLWHKYSCWDLFQTTSVTPWNVELRKMCTLGSCQLSELIPGHLCPSLGAETLTECAFQVATVTPQTALAGDVTVLAAWKESPVTVALPRVSPGCPASLRKAQKELLPVPFSGVLIGHPLCPSTSDSISLLPLGVPCAENVVPET